MTAVIGILNKTGVALAADSAVTISGGKERKIYNNAYKIFTLSKHHPVGIMLYNSASFMGIPWEILIKEYRKELNKKNFGTLQEYQDSFITYLKSRINLVPDDAQNETLSILIEFLFYQMIEETSEEHFDQLEKLRSEKAKREFLIREVSKCVEGYEEDFKNSKKLDGFQGFTLKKFNDKHKTLLNEFYKKFYTNIPLSRKTKQKLFNIVYWFIKSDNFMGRWTGLVLTGYGENEIFPSCLPLKIGEVFDNRIRYKRDTPNETKIDHNYSAALRPFAQRDVIDTILTGVDSQLKGIFLESFDSFLSDFVTKISNLIEKTDKKLAQKLLNLDITSLMNKYSSKMSKIQNKIHIAPLMSSIATLSKEDLAELAESLIYLTYLKRRMSFSEESVGGPVDVAIITKGDGFIWIKRKHYFDGSLNPNFISKYLNS